MPFKKAMLKKVGPRATKRSRRHKVKQMDGMKGYSRKKY